ncbi:MAG: preprotein translocase subunit SecE [bacterium]|nr:preprotein translocase subunit SecE [bacterium]
MAESPAASRGARSAEPGRSFFDWYKRGQGTYTRYGTAAGAGVIIAAGGDFLYKQLVFDSDAPWTLWVKIGVPLAVVVAMGLVVWWVVGVYRRSCDFMIATEGEMKKVSWSSRRELLGWAKVVIMFTALMAVILFTVDIIFMAFFNTIGVLRGASPWEVFFGS